MGFPGVSVIKKNLPTNARDIRDAGSVPGVGGIPGGGHGNPLQYSCLENPMDRGAQQAIVNGATKSWTLSDKAYTHTYTHTHTHTHAHTVVSAYQFYSGTASHMLYFPI